MKLKIIILFSLLPLLLAAQNTTGKTIAILDFEQKGRAPFEEVEQLYKHVETVFLEQKGWQVVDRKMIDLLQAEREKQKGDAFVDAAILAEQGKAIGAQYLLIGEVFDFKRQLKPYEYTDKETNYTERGFKVTTTFGASFRLVDTETGAIIETLTLDDNGVAAKAYAVPMLPPNELQYLEQRSIEKLYLAHLKKLRKWVKKMMPAEVLVLEQLSGKKSAQEVLIGGYLSNERRAYMKVYMQEYIEVDGEQLVREELVAYIRVYKIEANGFAVCKVVEGNKTLAKHLAAGKTLTCRPR